jgi:hypothetical protein
MNSHLSVIKVFISNCPPRKKEGKFRRTFTNSYQNLWAFSIFCRVSSKRAMMILSAKWLSPHQLRRTAIVVGCEKVISGELRIPFSAALHNLWLNPTRQPYYRRHYVWKLTFYASCFATEEIFAAECWKRAVNKSKIQNDLWAIPKKSWTFV